MIRLALLLAPLTVAGAEPLIRVDAIALTGEAISRRATALRASGKTFTAEQFVEALIDEAVLASEARRTGLDKDPTVRMSVEQEAARVLADAFAEGPLAASIAPTEAELLALYHQASDTVRLDLVAVATREEALQVKARLAAGGEFALEAARSLDARSGRNKGDTGPQTRMQMAPELAKAAFEAPIGQLLGPVPLTAGFGVARVTERTLADPAGFPARRGALEQFARKQGLATTKKHYVEQMRRKHGASIDQPFIDSLGSRTEATPAELDHAFATLGAERFPYRALLPRVRAMGGGHMQGAATKTKLAWTFLDERLLAKAARDEGLAARPATAIDVAAAENQALAAAMAERIRGSMGGPPSATGREDAVAARIVALRKDRSITVDRKAAAAAVGTQR